MFKLLTLILVSLVYVSTMMVGIDKLKSYCLSKELKEDDTLQLSFVCTGEQEDLLYVTLKSEQGVVHYENKLANSKYDYKGDFSMEAKTGTYTYCFESKAKTDLIVSFEIYTLKESGHVINLVKDGKI
jgi:hypothetical protein